MTAKKILTVDDSGTVRKLCGRIVGSLGFEVLEAENGKVALELIRANPDTSVVLLDWNMPVMNGLEFLKALRAEPLPQQPKVVMCTSESDFSRIAEAISAGADEYVMKPFNEEIVRGKLTEIGIL